MTSRMHFYIWRVTFNSFLSKNDPLDIKNYMESKTRGPKGHILCTWVQCATFLRNRPRRTFLFTDQPKKHKLGRGCWDLASCQVSLNSVQRFQGRSRKCLSQSEARAAILFFRSVRKNTNSVEDVEFLLPVKFRWILFSGVRGEVKNVKS